MIANATLHMPFVDVDPAVREHAAPQPGPVPATGDQPARDVENGS